MCSSPTTYSMTYFYPRPPRGGRRLRPALFSGGTGISIHALREEGDHRRPCSQALLHDFYPRPPRGGRRADWVDKDDSLLFLSTPSARRATVARAVRAVIVDISIHALREEGDRRDHADQRLRDISIHALREEGDQRLQHLPACHLHFYPRPPRGGRQIGFSSIAAPFNFYPRPPRGGRRSSPPMPRRSR